MVIVGVIAAGGPSGGAGEKLRSYHMLEDDPFLRKLGAVQHLNTVVMGSWSAFENIHERDPAS